MSLIKRSLIKMSLIKMSFIKMSLIKMSLIKVRLIKIRWVSSKWVWSKWVWSKWVSSKRISWLWLMYYLHLLVPLARQGGAGSQCLFVCWLGNEDHDLVLMFSAWYLTLVPMRKTYLCSFEQPFIDWYVMIGYIPGTPRCFCAWLPWRGSSAPAFRGERVLDLPSAARKLCTCLPWHLTLLAIESCTHLLWRGTSALTSRPKGVSVVASCLPAQRWRSCLVLASIGVMALSTWFQCRVW